jgi:hypothetical protein
MTTWLDHSSTGVLVLCHSCPSWREHARDTGAAWRKARAHAFAVHPDDAAAVRHAVKNAQRRK